MTKLKQFSTKFEKTIRGLEKPRALQAMECFSQVILGKSEFYGTLEEAARKQA